MMDASIAGVLLAIILAIAAYSPSLVKTCPGDHPQIKVGGMLMGGFP